METKTVLIIEDEDFIATLISRALKKEGYAVIVTGDCTSARRVIDTTSVDLIVSDVMLPYSGGMDILEHIKGTDSLMHIPVILVTGMDKTILFNSKTKADAILSKPFDMAELVSTVKSFFNAMAQANS